MAQLSSSKAKALALAMTGIAAVASFPTAAEAFTQKQCNIIDAAFTQHTQANFRHYSQADKVELGKFSNWLDAGCVKGDPIVLVRHPEVGAALSTVQTIVNRVQDVSLRVALSPTVSFIPPATAAAEALRPTQINASPRDGAIPTPTR
ncbi:MAG: hypothetical protein K2Z80_08740 [Xanthobacteraceae bacterium]|nr:hypothetical protein [Xanthobacteraceae bacterium]